VADGDWPLWCGKPDVSTESFIAVLTSGDMIRVVGARRGRSLPITFDPYAFTIFVLSNAFPCLFASRQP
jgi:hypothetical protein